MTDDARPPGGALALARFPALAGASVFVTGGGIGAALTRGRAEQGLRVAFVGGVVTTG